MKSLSLSLSLSLCALISLLALSGCSKDDSNPADSTPDPQLSISTTTLDFGNSSTSMTFIITNTGGGILNWAITTNQNWLTCDPVSGLTTTERDTIDVKVARVGLADGINTGTITVTPDVGSARTISVTLNIPAPERLWSFSVNSEFFEIFPKGGRIILT